MSPLASLSESIGFFERVHCRTCLFFCDSNNTEDLIAAARKSHAEKVKRDRDQAEKQQKVCKFVVWLLSQMKFELIEIIVPVMTQLTSFGKQIHLSVSALFTFSVPFCHR